MWRRIQQMFVRYALILADGALTASGTGGGGAITFNLGCDDVCTVHNNSFVENQAQAEGGAVNVLVRPGSDPDCGKPWP